MSSYLFSPSCLDPLQGMLDFVSDIKPFHTKILQAGISVAFDDGFIVGIAEDFASDVKQTFNTHRGHCITAVPPTSSFDGFESELFGDPNYVNPQSLSRAVSNQRVIVIYATNDGIAEGERLSLPSSTEQFVLRLYTSDSLLSGIVAESYPVTIRDGYLSTDPVAQQPRESNFPGGYKIITSTDIIYEQKLQQASTTHTDHVAFTISVPANQVVYYDIIQTSTGESVTIHDFTYPMSPGFEPTIKHELFVDTYQTLPVIGNPNFAYYTSTGVAVFYSSIHPFDATTSNCLDLFELETLEADGLEQTLLRCPITPVPYCLDIFELDLLEVPAMEATESICDDACLELFELDRMETPPLETSLIACTPLTCLDMFETDNLELAGLDLPRTDCTLPVDYGSCVNAFDVAEFDVVGFGFPTQGCDDTCDGNFLSGCSTSMTPCSDNSPTTLSTRFVELLSIADDLYGNILIR